MSSLGRPSSIEGLLARGGMTFHLRLRRDDDVLTLRVFADPARARRVFLRAGDLGIAHIEPRIPEPLREATTIVREVLAGGSDDPLATLVARLTPVSIEVLRAMYEDQRVPHWPPSMRSGPSGDGLWPYDAELLSAQLGLRRVIRREWLASDPARASDERWLADHGLRSVALPAADGRVVVLASVDPASLEEATATEPDVERPSPRWEDAAAKMGALLGYPPCCIRAFVSGRARDDASLFAERLPGTSHAPLPPEVLWLDAALALVSHAPCSPTCTATRALGEAIAAGLGSRAAPWRTLAARLHAITRSGRVLAIDATGTLATELRVIDAIEITPAAALPDVRPVSIDPALWLDGPWLHGLGEPCTLFADHRGADREPRSEAASLRSPSVIPGDDGSPSSTR